MDQKTINTRQRAEELLREAVSIWRQSRYSDYLEGIENDPVFSMLLTAVAYQDEITGKKIEGVKDEVLRSYLNTLLPYDSLHATPATACIAVNPNSGVQEVNLNSDSEFTLSGTSFRFRPLLHSKVLPASVSKLDRIDGRRWKVTLAFDFPVKDLSYFCFAIRNHSFRDVRLTTGNFELPVVKPWEFSRMPYSDIFSIDHALYNHRELYDPSSCVVDMFASQNLNLFSVEAHDSKEYIADEVSSLDIVIEFMGVTPDFTFDRSQIVLNPVVLANVGVHTVTLDSQTPFVQVDSSSDKNDTSQFMYMLKPSSLQTFADTGVRVRRDRGGDGKQNLTFIMMDKPDDSVSLDLSYLTTDGGAVTPKLSIQNSFSTPAGLVQTVEGLVCNPVAGKDRSEVDEDTETKIRCAMQTADRLVTPSDIKAFCLNELSARYGITPGMVRKLSVSHRLQSRDEEGGNASGYVVIVDIVVESTGFVRRSFEDRVPQVEILLGKMIDARTAGVYPVKVTISIQ